MFDVLLDVKFFKFNARQNYQNEEQRVGATEVSSSFSLNKEFKI